MIEVQQLSKAYGGEQVLRQLSLRLPAQQTLSVLGKSGGGKSTLLKIMAGLETADSGDFRVDGQSLLNLAPQLREVVYLSQEALLFPHLKVGDNLAFGLRVRKVPLRTVVQRVRTLAKQLGLETHLDKYPAQLSGGQKQRVSFGRALIINPKILLLDEPFGSLDSQTRREMQQLFRDIRSQYRITALFVTHDLKEALLMGDQIGILADGQLKVYPDPQTFVGAPESGAEAELAFWQQFTAKPA
ncbi:MAG: ATP-binding cassette domain-containing protein [Bacteroidetes bacterium]|nr:MAG: ATP-binding cassette domain-containing protein [Bacteroidota bacterium]